VASRPRRDDVAPGQGFEAWAGSARDHRHGAKYGMNTGVAADPSIRLNSPESGVIRTRLARDWHEFSRHELERRTLPEPGEIGVRVTDRDPVRARHVASRDRRRGPGPPRGARVPEPAADYAHVLRQQGGGVTKAWQPGAPPTNGQPDSAAIGTAHAAPRMARLPAKCRLSKHISLITRTTSLSSRRPFRKAALPA
jgi:hypothetical protein